MHAADRCEIFSQHLMRGILFLGASHPEGDRKDSIPITTRQLESLIRLSQARAKACLRPTVIKEDAEDVVELMIESVRQVNTDENGKLDKGRGGTGGKGKKSKAFLDAMRNSGQSMFSMWDLRAIADKVQFSLNEGSIGDFVEKLRNDGEILKVSEGDGCFYKLNSYS